MANPLSGHTAGANDSLKDGSHIVSPSLTNLYEGVRGNGIILLQDAISDNSDRNTPANLPGAVVTHSDANTVTVKGGLVVLDNVVYSFAGGPGNTQNVVLNQASSNVHKNGTFDALETGEECLFVIYLCSDGDAQHIHFQQGTNITSASAYPTTPSGFLTTPDSSHNVHQSVVLATVRAIYNGSASGTNAGSDGLKITISEINDKRHFIRPSPIYLSPMTGDSGASVDSNTDLDNLHDSSAQQGDFSGSDLGAIWMSRGPDDTGDTETNDVLYFSGYQDGARRTFRLGPGKFVTVASGGGTKTFTFDGGTVFRFNTNTATNLNPDGTFPSGHMVIISNLNSVGQADLTFDSTALNDTINPQESSIYVYSGSAWVRIFEGSSISYTPAGSTGHVQYKGSDGAFDSEAAFTYTEGTNTLTLAGPIVMNTGAGTDSTGLLKTPSGVQFQKTNTNPGSTAADTLWVDDDDSDKLKFGASAIQMADEAALIDINGLAAADIASGDFLAFSDTNASNNVKKESIDDIATLFAGTGLTASSAVINIDANQPTITSIGPAGNLTVNQDLIVTGTLTVNGATTTVNSTTLTIDDKLIELAHSPSGSEGNDAAIDGGGIILKSSDSDKSIVFTDSTDSWTFNQHLFPSADSTYNLGSSSVRFANGYFDALTSTLGTFTNIAVDTNLIKTDSTNNFVGINQTTPLAPLHIGESGYGSGSVDTSSSSTSTALTINLFVRNSFRTAKLLVEVENRTDDVNEATELLLVHNGTDSADSASDAFVSVSNQVQSDGSETQQATYDAGVSGANVQLEVTPLLNSKDIHVKVAWQAI